MKAILWTVLLLALTSVKTARAQAVEYSYDSAGNRIRRGITVRHTKERETTSAKDILAEDLRSSVRIEPDSKAGTVTVAVDGFKTGDKCDIALFNTAGVNILSIAAKSRSTLVDLRPYPDGVYVVGVNLNGKRDSWKVTKKYK